MPIDTGALRGLHADMGRVTQDVGNRVKATTARAALNIKKDMQREVRDSGTTYFGGVEPSISYDVTVVSGGIVADIGPAIGRAQGSLAWIAYEGSATSGPSLPDPSGALEREADAYERYLLEAVTDGLG